MKTYTENNIELEERELPYLLKSFADKSGSTEAHVKDLFQKAKLRAKDQLGYSSVKNFDQKAWRYTVGILKNMLGLSGQKKEQIQKKGEKNKDMKKIESTIKDNIKTIKTTKPVILENRFIPAGTELIVELPQQEKNKKSIIKEDYNGWTNWETWQINLWVGDMAYDENIKWTPALVKDYTLDLYPNGTPDMKSRNDYKKVNWKELAISWNS